MQHKLWLVWPVIALSIGWSSQGASAQSSCSTANNTVICIADLDGDGKQEIIVGHMPAWTPGIGNVPDSYLFVLDSNGRVRKELCMSNGAGSSTVSCPPSLTKGKGD